MNNRRRTRIAAVLSVVLMSIPVVAQTGGGAIIDEQTGIRTNLLPDLQVLPPTDLHVVGSREEGTQRLKFTTTIWNAGRGPLEVRGAANPETGELEVYQFARTADGEMTQVGHVGTFDYEHRHGHLHLSTFARYQLWSLDDQGNPLAVITENHKVGFCLMDIDVIDPERAEGAVYAGCQAEVQGISVGYGDEYVAQLYEQDLDVSDVPDGDYALVNLANPESAIRETSYQNNTATVYLRLEAGRLVS